MEGLASLTDFPCRHTMGSGPKGSTGEQEGAVRTEFLWLMLAWAGIICGLVWAVWVTRTRPPDWTGWGMRRDTYRLVLAVGACVGVLLAFVTTRGV